MFHLNLGDTANSLVEKDYNDLAELTEGYSDSDIATLTLNAIYEPLRKCQQAKFYKKIDKGIVPWLSK